MNTPPRQQNPSTPSRAMPLLLSEGDERWARQSNQWRERQLALPWPAQLLQSFCLRMSSKGMCVSQAMMLCDRQYAMEQLAHAHNLDDEVLRGMAVELFRHDESRQCAAGGIQ